MIKDHALIRRSAIVFVAAGLVLLAVVASAGARGEATGQKKAAPPCWKVLTNDAFDGTVDGLYPLATYGEAVKHLPTDVQSYSTIADVIARARQSALQKRGEGIKADPARCGYALGSTSGSPGTTTGGGSRNGGSGNGGAGTTTGGGSGNGKGPIPGVIDSVGSDNADSFPVALIAIAAIAGLLVLGGGAGFLVRRRQRHQAELEAASGATPADDDDRPSPPELGP